MRQPNNEKISQTKLKYIALFFYNIYQRSSNKKTGRWSASPVRTGKIYLYMTELLKKIVTLRLEDRVGIAQNMVLKPDYPRRISAVFGFCTTTAHS